MQQYFLWVTIGTLVLLGAELVAGRHRGAYRKSDFPLLAGAFVALASGLIGMALGALVVATSDGGIGTGNGRAGAYVALVVGLIATVLGGLALARSRRITA